MQLLMEKTKQALEQIDYIELMSEHWRITRVRFGSACSYFYYAETQVLDCESERSNLSREFKPTKHHSCAIAAYGHMKSALRFLIDIAVEFKIDIDNYSKWIEEITYKRDRLQAHPNEKEYDKTIMVHESRIMGNEIIFPLWDQNLQKAEDRINITIDVRQDLNLLAELLEKISEELLRRYLEEKAGKANAKN